MSTLPQLAAHQASIVGISFSQAPHDRVLAGLIAQGHGREACATYLGLTDEALMDRVVRLGLPTPSDRPTRNSTQANAWTVGAIRHLVDAWTRNLASARIAEAVGRSVGSVRYKVRWLGLYRRDRSSLLQVLPLFPALDDASQKRCEIEWTDDLERWLADRWLSFQKHRAIARDLSAMLGRPVSGTTVASKAHRLELPKRDPYYLLDTYAPENRRKHAHLMPRGLTERRCPIRHKLFWSTNTFTSQEAKGQGEYRARCSGMDESSVCATTH